jgi:hypothetical protein
MLFAVVRGQQEEACAHALEPVARLEPGEELPVRTLNAVEDH